MRHQALQLSGDDAEALGVEGLASEPTWWMLRGMPFAANAGDSGVTACVCVLTTGIGRIESESRVSAVGRSSGTVGRAAPNRGAAPVFRPLLPGYG